MFKIARKISTIFTPSHFVLSIPSINHTYFKFSTEASDPSVKLSEIKKKRPVKNLPKLEQTQSIEAIFDYYIKNQRNLGPSQYMIILSRLAHLKDKQVDPTNPVITKILGDINKIPLHKDPELLTAFIKYTALCRITDRSVWRKYLASLRRIDIKETPKYFALTVNYLAKAGIKDPKLWEGLQDESSSVLDASQLNMSYNFTELFLNAFLNKQLKPDLELKLVQRIKKHIAFADFNELQKLWMFVWKYKLNDAELSQYLRKWTLYKLEKNIEESTLSNSVPYISYSLSQIIVNNQFAKSDPEVQNFVKKFWELLQVKKDSYCSNTKDAANFYTGLISAFNLCEINDEALHSAVNSYFLSKFSEVGPKEVMLLTKTIEFEKNYSYLGAELTGLIQLFLEKNVASIEIADVLSLVQLLETANKLKKEKIYQGIVQSIDLFIQTNPKKNDVIIKILENLEKAKVVKADFIEEKKELLNKVQFQSWSQFEMKKENENNSCEFKSNFIVKTLR